jgi:multisubunit Na+/H+ antiporter MnhC subunit
MDYNSPEFRRKFPKIVLTVIGVGLALIAFAAVATMVGYEP